MKQLVSLNINGDVTETAIEPGATLLQVLRDEQGLVGPKRGCDTGGCGCCTVLIDGFSRYSCMTYARSVQGRAITTVEGLASGTTVDAVQQAFVDQGAVQCGYCSCGFIMAAEELLAHNDNPSEAEIRQAIAGNLCRCTGYQKIVKAIGAAAGG